jgi:hypothetical protein
MDKKKVAKKGLRIAAGVLTLGISEWTLHTRKKNLAAPWNEFLLYTENFTKKMVVRTYGSREQKKMEAEGSALLENGYAMQGQSGFAERRAARNGLGQPLWESGSACPPRACRGESNTGR